MGQAKVLISGLLGCGILLFGTGCGQAGPSARGPTASVTAPAVAVPAARTPSPAPVQRVAVAREYAFNYPDLAALKRAADLVVAGTVVRAIGVAADETGAVWTDFEFAIRQVGYDPQGRVHGASVVVHQMGGRLGDTEWTVDGDPLLQVGERGVLFLQESRPGRFETLDGPIGRFPVRDGQVHPLVDYGVTLDRPMTESTFVDAIRALPVPTPGATPTPCPGPCPTDTPQRAHPSPPPVL